MASDRDGAERLRLGADLRAARLRIGWDLAEIAAALRIRHAYLEALEEGRLAALPGRAYALGFLRSYATALGLDPDEITRRFREEAGDANRRTELTFPAPVPERGVPAGAVALVGLVLAAGAYAGWYRLSGGGTGAADTVPPVPARLASLADTAVPAAPSADVKPPAPPQAARVATAPPPTAPAASPVPVAPPAAAPAAKADPPAAQPAPAVSPLSAVAASLPAAAPAPTVTAAPGGAPAGRIVIRAVADSWIQVRQKGGPVLLSRLLPAGESWIVPADRPDLLLTTGNAGGTELVVGGVAGPPLGNPGAVRRDLPLDPELIQAGRPTAPASTAHARPQ